MTIASFCRNISKQASIEVVSCFPCTDVTKKIVAWTILPSTQMVPSGPQVSKSGLRKAFSLIDKLLGFPNVFTAAYKHGADPSVPSPSSAHRITINTGPQAFYGEKFKIDKIFEDDGSLASGTTSAAYDSERHRLFLHGNSQT